MQVLSVHFKNTKVWVIFNKLEASEIITSSGLIHTVRCGSCNHQPGGSPGRRFGHVLGRPQEAYRG